MCKPGKSFNTGIKSYSFRHMKMPCKSSRAGGAPSRTDALIGPAACGRGPNPDSLKRRASARALSLLTLLKLAWNSSSLANAGRTARWNLAPRPAETNNTRVNQRPCKHRNIAKPASNNIRDFNSPVTSRDSEASQQSFPEQHVTEFPRENETKASSLLQQRKQVTNQTFLTLTKLVKFDLNAVTEHTYLFVIFFWLVKL